MRQRLYGKNIAAGPLTLPQRPKKCSAMPPRLILGSASPRRRELLRHARLEHTVQSADIDESIVAGEPALAAAARLAIEKAQVVAATFLQGDVVLAADTLVACNGAIFGKPRDEAEAVEMLMQLSGRNHEVVTAWVLVPVAAAPGAAVAGACVSLVRMREFSRSVARRYAAGGEPLDKAGAYAFQGAGRALVSTVIGSADNVIGLPVAQVVRALAGLGIRPT
jgi:septum formation protein